MFFYEFISFGTKFVNAVYILWYQICQTLLVSYHLNINDCYKVDTTSEKES